MKDKESLRNCYKFENSKGKTQNTTGSAPGSEKMAFVEKLAKFKSVV